MIVEEPFARYSDAREVLQATEQRIQLFMNDFQVIEIAPSRCAYCGQGRYEGKPEEASMSMEQAMLRRWRIYTCETCGHMLFFGKTAQNESW
jgi:uncharacterized protein with PIN domain